MDRSGPAPVVDVERLAARERYAFQRLAIEDYGQDAVLPSGACLEQGRVLYSAQYPTARRVDQAEHTVANRPVHRQFSDFVRHVATPLDGSEADPGDIHRPTLSCGRLNSVAVPRDRLPLTLTNDDHILAVRRGSGAFRLR